MTPSGAGRPPPLFEEVPTGRRTNVVRTCRMHHLAAGAATAGATAASTALASVITGGVGLSASANARERRDEPTDLGAATVLAHDGIRHSALLDEKLKSPRTIATRIFVDRHVDLLNRDTLGCAGDATAIPAIFVDSPS
jgi:hypothetical protein